MELVHRFSRMDVSRPDQKFHWDKQRRYISNNKSITKTDSQIKPEEENPEIGNDEDSLEGQSLEDALAEHIDVAELADESSEIDSETEKKQKKGCKL